MNSNTNIHGSDNKVAGRDIHVHNYHHPKRNTQPSSQDEYLGYLQQDLIASLTALSNNRKKIFLTPSFFIMISLTIISFIAFYYVGTEIIERLSSVDTWTSTNDIAIHEPTSLWWAALFIPAYIAIVWWGKVSDPIYATIRIHKQEIAKLEAKIQRATARINK